METRSMAEWPNNFTAPQTVIPRCGHKPKGGGEFFFAFFPPPRRHRLVFAVEHRVAKPREIILREFTQVERNPAGIDHVASVTCRAGVGVEIATLLDEIGFGGGHSA